jgi:hypothetical protein
MTAERAMALIPDLLVWRYDYVFIVLGGSDLLRLTAAKTWRREMSELLALLTDEVAVSAHIVVAGQPSIAGVKRITWPFSTIITRHSETFNKVTAELCSSLPRVRYVETVAPDMSTSKGSYALSAAQLVGALARVVNNEEQIVGTQRRPKVGHLSPAEGEPVNFDRVLELVHRAFTLEIASVAVVENDRRTGIDASGILSKARAQAHRFADSAPRSHHVIIVRDTRKDKRFAWARQAGETY